GPKDYRRLVGRCTPLGRVALTTPGDSAGDDAWGVSEAPTAGLWPRSASSTPEMAGAPCAKGRHAMRRSVSSAPSGLARLLGNLLLSAALLLWGLCAGSLAQITLDGSLGPRGPLPGPHYRIPAEVGQIRGTNLFHSFGEFNVPTQGSVTCTGPQTITN